MLRFFNVSFIIGLSVSITFSKNTDQNNIIPGELIMKLRPNTEYISRSSQSTGIPEIDRVLVQYQVDEISPVVPYKKRNPNLPDVNRIYKVKFFDDIDPGIICNSLNSLSEVLYAEPRIIYYETTIPNDPDYSNQWHLPVIGANNAWNITQGDTNVIIAIVDDAVDLDHEDLQENIFTNWTEYFGSSGVDDDGNGYIDDIHGWDFAGNDNDPNPAINGQDHGTHVAGCASAVTDNGIGVAAPGWSCKILPLKFSNDQNGFLTGDNAAAIIYAADMGATVTNNSYGGGGYSNYDRDAFLYAYGLGTLSFASAGNSGIDEANYPASYPYVQSVASTQTGDNKSSFSTYNLSVDVSSPGSSILSTIPNNQYATFSGTSMSSPVAAGVAALIKSNFPDLTPYELAIRLGGTADDIYGINPDYFLKLGPGRVNAYNGVSYTDAQLVNFPTRLDLISSVISDSAFGNSDFIYDPGETVQVSLELYNYSMLGSDNIDLELTTNNANLSIQNGSVSDLSVSYEDTLIVLNAFSVEISDSAAIGSAEMELRIYQDGEFLLSHGILMNIGTAPILVVDDDNNIEGAPNTELFYTTILDSLGISYFIHKRSNGPLILDQLTASPIVIWFTEWAFPSLDYDDRKVLASYLDMGGNLYLSGQDLGWDLNENPGDSSQTAFYSNYMRADWGGDDANVSFVTGVPGNSISDGLNFDVYQPGYPSSNQYPDYFTPTDGAELIFQYSNRLGMGLSYAGGYRLVYTGVGLETFGSSENSNAPDDVNDIQETFLERTLDFLNFISHTPLTDTEDSTATIKFHVKLFNDGDGISIPTLNYKIGDANYISVQMLDTLDGYYFWVDGPDSSVNVKYYFSVSTQYYNWTNPINLDSPHMFNIGRDLIPPNLRDLSQLENRIDRSGTEDVVVEATDNIGVGEATLYWYYSSAPDEVETTGMVYNNNRWTGTLTYSDLPGNETVYYFASAVDSTSNANVGYSDTLSFKIINTTTLTTWDDDRIGPWDTGDNWGLMFINDQIEKGMNDSPSSSYENDKSDTLTLLTPFQISDYNTAYLQFWNGSFLRDGDHGTVELSDNMTDWTQEYTITGMNVTETVTLNITDFKETGVYIRFLIQTNESDVSSGWYIDDIQLLVDTTIVLSNVDQIHLPVDYSLYQNFPNPFNPVTIIYYDVPVQSKIDIKIYDLLGRQIKTLYKGTKNPGNHSIMWNGKDSFGKQVSAGVYLYQFQAGNYVQTRKMILLK